MMGSLVAVGAIRFKRESSIMLGLQFDRIAGFDVLRSDRMLKHRPTAIILHGYGADFQDLAGLAAYLDRQSAINWVFPNGPDRLAYHPISSGRAWFPIETDILKEQPHIDFTAGPPAGLEAAATRIQDLIQDLSVDTESLILGGFSQGAIVSCQAALTLDKGPHALVQLSSTIVGGEVWPQRLRLHRNLSIFQSHGRGDDLLRFQHAEALHQLFKEHCQDVDFIAFGGGHEIPALVIDKLRFFIEKLLR